MMPLTEKFLEMIANFFDRFSDGPLIIAVLSKSHVQYVQRKKGRKSIVPRAHTHMTIFPGEYQ